MSCLPLSEPIIDVNHSAVLEFKSAALYALRLVLHHAHTADLVQALTAHLDDAGDFFRDEPVVIDAQALQSAPDWPALARLLHERGLILLGVSAPDPLHGSVREAGLAVLQLQGTREPDSSIHRDPDHIDLDRSQAGVAHAAAPDMAEPARAGAATHPETPADTAPSTPPVTPAAPPSPASTDSPAPAADKSGGQGGNSRPTLILDRSLRSGQKVYARQADLVVIGMVSPGAEVIADGNIHVYGPLRGKAMAGAQGDENARIFATRLDAELVAVAGVYRVIEARLPTEVHDRAATVRLEHGQLQLLPLAI